MLVKILLLYGPTAHSAEPEPFRIFTEWRKANQQNTEVRSWQCHESIAIQCIIFLHHMSEANASYRNGSGDASYCGDLAEQCFIVRRFFMKQSFGL